MSYPSRKGDEDLQYSTNNDDSVDSLLGLINDRGTKSKAYKSIGPAGKFLNVAVFLLLIGAVATCLVLFVFTNSKGNENTSDLSVCYQSPSCPKNNKIPYSPTDGFTNDTGWSSSPITSSECCQICLEGTTVVTCFNASDANCLSKTGHGDFDYLMFDQMWLPQFCAALEQGHDFTLTHLPGTKCDGNKMWLSNLSIHGLWPNYYDGYPQCCPVSNDESSYAKVANSQVPLIPAEVATWDIWTQLQSAWVDPTISPVQNCSVCSNLNHEWQKHGSCLSTTFTPSSQENYFKSALTISTLLTDYTTLINKFAGMTVTKAQIEALYPTKVNVICDPRDISGEVTADTGVFSELQTCWELSSGKSLISSALASDFTMVDCKPAGPALFTTPCPVNVFVRL